MYTFMLVFLSLRLDIPVRGCGILHGCAMLSIPYYLDNRFTDGGKFVRSAHRSHFTTQKHYFSVSGTQFCQSLSEPQGLVRPEGLRKLKKNPPHWSSTHQFPACVCLIECPSICLCPLFLYVYLSSCVFFCGYLSVLIYSVRQFNFFNDRSMLRPTHVPKHVWTRCIFELHELQTK
jgi:hypothetical protein